MAADRRRDRALRIAGWHPSRISIDEIADDELLADDIRALLAAAAGSTALGGRVTGHRAA